MMSSFEHFPVVSARCNAYDRGHFRRCYGSVLGSLAVLSCRDVPGSSRSPNSTGGGRGGDGAAAAAAAEG
jgi:hypothetical protein